MAHSRVWNSACKGVKTRLLANEPTIPPPKKLSSLCQAAGVSSPVSSWDCSMIWAVRQLSASARAICMVSNGEISLPLKALSLRAFHMYQMTHETVAMIFSGIASSFARHNTPGECGKSARAQAWTDGRHSKSRWFRVSSSAPHLGQDRSVPQWRSESELQTGRQLEIAC
ncbi:hypothetical protein Bca52824_039878 [Brassica carinata]|uniref:Uncharacterized protein n=1 Tax=Brassica carinata TaxID=52824 RepID=A0A8X7RQA4_BRACI|nr:hypothetical protein Bca52824_039878 [Brassica carinata]